MTCGSLGAWTDLNALRYDTAATKSLVHCAAGMGRSGTVMVFNLLKLVLTQLQLQTEYLGFNDSLGLFNSIYGIRTHIINNDDLIENGAVINATITSFDINDLYNEVFNITSLFHINLFLARINNIFLSIATSLNLINQNMYLYPLHLGIIQNAITPNNMFSPTPGVINYITITNALFQTNYGIIGTQGTYII